MKARTSFVTNSSSTCFMITMKNTLTFDDFIDELWSQMEGSFKKSFKDALNNRVKTMEQHTTYLLEVSNEDCDCPLMQTLYYMDNDLQNVDTPNFSIDYYQDYEDDEYDDDPGIDSKRSRKIVRLN